MDAKSDFPIFKNNPDLVYLDSAATTQKPESVINAVKEYYEKENANPSRGIYDLSEEVTEKYEATRKKVAEFINAEPEAIIFTKGTTESMNILCHRILPLIAEGKNEIVLSEMEHHSNLIPWQEFAKKHDFVLKFIPVTDSFELDLEKAKELVGEKTAIVSVTHMSNVLGTVNDVKQIVILAKSVGALTIVDAAQSVSKMKVDVQNIGCDFLAFSGHKMYGPMGVGILYGKKDHLEKMDPLLFGGGMVNSASFDGSEFRELPYKFEAGTQNAASVIGFSKAIEFVLEHRDGKVEFEMVSYALEKLRDTQKVNIFAASVEKNVGIISFTIEGVHPHDVASILNEQGIAIRAGDHCAMPLHQKLGIPASCRVSFGVYNTKEDVDKLIDGIKKVLEVFKL